MKARTQLLVLTLGAASLAACGGEATAPAAPGVDAPPAITNQSPITLTGLAEEGALVQVRGGDGAPAEATAAADGRYSVEVPLRADAENMLLVSQVVGGLESAPTTVQIEHDGTGPAAPTLDPVTSPTRMSTSRIRGTTEAGATVRVTGGLEDAEGTADASGRFELEVSLETSDAMQVENELAVIARDVAGNDGEAATVTVLYDDAIGIEAPLLDAFPGFVSAATMTLEGEAVPGVMISAVGGATDGEATVDAEGRFAVTFGLRANQRNEIRVFAVTGGTTSSPASAVVVHDDRAPEAPVLDPQPSETGAASLTLTGEAEAGSTVTIAGGAASATGAADDAGRFAIDVTLTADSVNDLSAISVDLAGNESAAALLAITHDGSLEVPVQVDPITSPTSELTVTLSGSTTASVEVEITGGADPVTATSDASGDWTADVTLSPNARNELRVTRQGSGIETIVVLVHDDIAPDAPALNELPSPTGNTLLSVTGTAEPLARISVSGGVAAVAGTAAMDGRFAIAITLAADATSDLSVLATDRAGNSSSPSTATVTHSSSVPEAPIVDVPNPAPTNVATHLLTGRVSSPGADIDIVVRGGMAEATGTTDPSTGTFSIEVALVANTLNELEVVSLEGAIESPPGLVSITHDDIAPAAPTDLTATAGTCVAGIPTGGSVSGAMGSVEARATVRVANVTRATSATTAATDGGSFSVGLGSCTSQVIRVTATDAAGNESAPTEVNAM